MSLPSANSVLVSLGLAGLDKAGALRLPGVWSVSGPGGVEVRPVPRLWGLPVCPIPAGWGSPSGLEHGAGSCGGCGVGGCSAFRCLPKEGSPRGSLTRGGGLPAAWEEAGVAGAEGSARCHGLGLLGMGPLIRKNPVVV